MARYSKFKLGWALLVFLGAVGISIYLIRLNYTKKEVQQRDVNCEHPQEMAETPTTTEKEVQQQHDVKCKTPREVAETFTSKIEDLNTEVNREDFISVIEFLNHHPTIYRSFTTNDDFIGQLNTKINQHINKWTGRIERITVVLQSLELILHSCEVPNDDLMMLWPAAQRYMSGYNYTYANNINSLKKDLPEYILYYTWGTFITNMHAQLDNLKDNDYTPMKYLVLSPAGNIQGEDTVPTIKDGSGVFVLVLLEKINDN